MALKRIWTFYKKYKQIIKIISAIIGVVLGISACITFAKKFHNYHAAGWAAFSSVCALFFLHIVFAVRRDLERKIQPETFVVYMVIGCVGILAGSAVLVTYITIGAINHESGQVVFDLFTIIKINHLYLLINYLFNNIIYLFIDYLFILINKLFVFMTINILIS